jgi:hypothetical protein
LPPDLESKLLKLSAGTLLHRSIEQNCRLFIAILQAAYAGQFPEAGADDCARLLRVLAYVRKWDDEIPDYRPDGFVDDQEEVRAAANQLADLIRKFKAWRLRHQVPSMWKLGHIA